MERLLTFIDAEDRPVRVAERDAAAWQEEEQAAGRAVRPAVSFLDDEGPLAVPQEDADAFEQESRAQGRKVERALPVLAGGEPIIVADSARKRFLSDYAKNPAFEADREKSRAAAEAAAPKVGSRGVAGAKGAAAGAARGVAAGAIEVVGAAAGAANRLARPLARRAGLDEWAEGTLQEEARWRAEADRLRSADTTGVAALDEMNRGAGRVNQMVGGLAGVAPLYALAGPKAVAGHPLTQAAPALATRGGGAVKAVLPTVAALGAADSGGGPKEMALAAAGGLAAQGVLGAAAQLPTLPAMAAGAAGLAGITALEGGGWEDALASAVMGAGLAGMGRGGSWETARGNLKDGLRPVTDSNWWRKLTVRERGLVVRRIELEGRADALREWGAPDKVVQAVESQMARGARIRSAMRSGDKGLFERAEAERGAGTGEGQSPAAAALERPAAAERANNLPQQARAGAPTDQGSAPVVPKAGAEAALVAAPGAGAVLPPPAPGWVTAPAVPRGTVADAAAADALPAAPAAGAMTPAPDRYAGMAPEREAQERAGWPVAAGRQALIVRRADGKNYTKPIQGKVVGIVDGRTVRVRFTGPNGGAETVQDIALDRIAEPANRAALRRRGETLAALPADERKRVIADERELKKVLREAQVFSDPGREAEIDALQGRERAQAEASYVRWQVGQVARLAGMEDADAGSPIDRARLLPAARAMAEAARAQTEMAGVQVAKYAEPAAVDTATLESGDMVWADGEWHSVGKVEGGAVTELRDGYVRVFETGEDAVVQGVLREGDAGYERALEEYRTQEAEKTAQREIDEAGPAEEVVADLAGVERAEVATVKDGLRVGAQVAEPAWQDGAVLSRNADGLWEMSDDSIQPQETLQDVAVSLLESMAGYHVGLRRIQGTDNFNFVFAEPRGDEQIVVDLRDVLPTTSIIPSPTLTLDSQTPADVAAERERITAQREAQAERDEIARRAAARITGTAGDVAQPGLPGTGGAVEENLFNRAPEAQPLEMRGTAAPGSGPRSAAARAPDWALQGAESKAGAELVRRTERGEAGLRDVVNMLNAAVGAEMRFSKTQTTRKHPANYRPRGHLVFTRSSQSQINFHEAGHAMKELAESRAPGVWNAMEEDLLALTQAPGSMASAKNVHEGVAEWFRLRVTDPAALEGSGLNGQVEAALAEHLPQVAAAVRDAARAMQRFNQLPAAKRWDLFNRENRERPSMARAVAALYRLGTAAADGIASGAPVSRLERSMFRATVRGRAEAGATYREALRKAREGRRETRGLGQAYNMILSIGSETTTAMQGEGAARGLRVIGADGKFTYLSRQTWREIAHKVPAARWEQFMQAGWALEALNRYQADGLEYPGMREGITPADLGEIVQQAKRDMPDFAERFKEVQGYFDALLDLKDLGGLKKDGEVEKMRRRELYWPLPRVADRTGSAVGAQGRQDVRSGDFRARGSSEAIRDLNVVAEARTRDALTSYYWNRFGTMAADRLGRMADDKALPMEARALAGRAFVRMKLPTRVAATLSKEEGQKIVYEYVVAQMAKELGVTPEEVATTMKPEDIAIAWEFKDLYRPDKPRDVNVVSILRAGEREFYQVGDDAMFMMFARPEKEAKWFEKAVKWSLPPALENWKRMITQSLPFGVNNVVGDAINQMMLNPDRVGWFPGGATALGLMNKLTGKYPQVRQEGILLSRVQRSSTELVNNVKQNAAWAFLSEGFYVSQAKDPTVRLMATVLQPSNWLFPVWKMGDIINLVTGGRKLAPLGETATREGAAVAVLRGGGTDEEAMDAYWRVTGRFNEHSGVQDMRLAMSLPGFFNPMLQAVRGAAQNLFDPDPAVAASMWARLLVVFPAIFGTIALTRWLTMSEEEREREKERPIDDRMNYHDVAGFRVRFPYGPEGAMGSWVYNAVMDDLLERKSGDARRQARMMLKRIADFGTLSQFFGPQINTLTEAGANWSSFRQKHIVSPWLAALPASEQYASTTPEFYRKLGQWADYSPAKLQYIVQQGISRQLDETIRFLDDKNSGKPIAEPADVPIIGRMFIRNPVGFGSASVETLGDIDDRMRVLDRRLKAAGYEWLRGARWRDVPAELVDLRVQLEALELLRKGQAPLRQMADEAKAWREYGNFAEEHNMRTLMTRYAQSLLAVNPEAAEEIETALELLKGARD